ncbi:MAG TPA: hypothetical protein VFD01_10455 [Candidatus Dormibacteraeota bacterium]|jgi:hypothetical protein|nr:hypothetical protein [Candidatus Dormibacteraeota bacterium]
MPWGDVALQLLALLVYPGALFTGAVGAVCELGIGLLLGGRAGAAEALRHLVGVLRELPGDPAALLAWLFASLAACGSSVPLAPAASSDGNLLLSAVALAAAAWLGGMAFSGEEGGARRLLLGQLCWLVALLAPALSALSLRPQALGAVTVPALMPVKILSGLLYLLCLPVLLGVPVEPRHGIGEPASGWWSRGGAAALSTRLRVFLWLPACGLLASAEVPPPPADPTGALRFLGVVLGLAAAAVGSAAVARRLGWSLQLRLAPPLAGLVLVAAVVTMVTS